MLIGIKTGASAPRHDMFRYKGPRCARVYLHDTGKHEIVSELNFDNESA